jgi:ribonuclease HII
VATLVAGLDEAGRGPVFGPLVVACVVTADPEALKALGARDSKALKPSAREALEGPIKAQAAGFALEVLEPAFIDRERARRSLNEVEGAAFARAAAAAARAAGATSIEVLQADAADAKESNFRAMVVRGLSEIAPKLRVSRYEVHHKADALYPAVSAASILAKVERDRRIKAIAVKHGANIGSGYPSDPVTSSFLREYISANKDAPPFARRSWKTVRQMLNEAGLGNHALDAFDEGGDAP